MGLDVCLKESKSKTSKSILRLTIPEDIHRYIFSGKNFWLSDYYQFSRINDYYKNTEYRRDELKILKKELIDIKRNIQDEQIIQLIDNLLSISAEALEKGLNLYFVAD